MKNVLIIGGVVIVIALAAYFLIPAETEPMLPTNEPATNLEVNEGTETSEARSVVTPGSYMVNADASSVSWAGKKPLLEGYINDGSIGLQSGDITVTEDSASGSFTIDMNTLSVSNTPTKPGSESMLAEHLMSDRWFNVAEFPTATFEITTVTARPDSETTLVYDVAGTLTMKGVTNPITFPATIYKDVNGNVVAEASLEIDRTLWDITAGSASFFDNLADNAVDNMIALSFSLVAEPQ